MPRYEYRVWGEQLADVARRLIAAGERAEVRQTEETYISLPSPSLNPKIRAGLLDVKVLVEVVDGFERWDPRLKFAFPVAADSLRASFFPLLGLGSPSLQRGSYTANEFVDEVVWPHPSLSAVEVVKLRVSYRLTGCLAEISDVIVAGRGMQTVAVESEDLALLHAACSRIDLQDLQNRSYPTMIKEILGRSAA